MGEGVENEAWGPGWKLRCGIRGWTTRCVGQGVGLWSFITLRVPSKCLVMWVRLWEWDCLWCWCIVTWMVRETNNDLL